MSFIRKLFCRFEKLNKKIAKLSLSIIVGVITMFLVYIAIQDSIKVPSLSRIPILSDTAVSIVTENEDGFAIRTISQLDLFTLKVMEAFLNLIRIQIQSENIWAQQGRLR